MDRQVSDENEICVLLWASTLSAPSGSVLSGGFISQVTGHGRLWRKAGFGLPPGRAYLHSVLGRAFSAPADTYLLLHSLVGFQ